MSTHGTAPIKPKLLPSTFEGGPAFGGPDLEVGVAKTDRYVNASPQRGMMNKDNRYLASLLGELDGSRFTSAVASQRDKLRETVFATTYAEIDGKSRKVRERQVPKHEFILGQKFITPSFVKARDKVNAGKTKETLTDRTMDRFSDLAEDFAKRSGNEQNGTYSSIFDSKGNPGTRVAFSWTEPNEDDFNRLTGQTERATVSFTIEASDEDKEFFKFPSGKDPDSGANLKTLCSRDAIPDNLMKTVHYALVEDLEGQRTVQRHVWLSDPDFQMPQFSRYPEDLVGDERTEYDKLLAGVIENTQRMEASVNEGYAVGVDNIEASEAISVASKAD